MHDYWFSVLQAMQIAEWQGYQTAVDNGRYTATSGNAMFYLSTDDNGRSYRWVDIT